MLIEADDAEERGAEFKRAGKLGQENEHSMQARMPRPSAIFLPSIFLPDHSSPVTQRHLNRVHVSMSAMSPIVGELRAFAMNACGNRAAAGKR